MSLCIGKFSSAHRLSSANGKIRNMARARDWLKSTFDPNKDIEINKIFKLAVKHKASDIHLQVDRPPVLRIRGNLKELEMPPIAEGQMVDLTFPMMDQRNLDIFIATARGLFQGRDLQG
ncbi:MAG: hypothetical protein R3C19_07175 [Planctomycetaceae bacterium]